MMDRLKKRWNVTSNIQVIMILVVFALTGTTVLVIKEPIFHWMGLEFSEMSIAVKILYYIVILPVYMGFLLIYGNLLGQGGFFNAFVKKSFSRFSRKNKNP